MLYSACRKRRCRCHGAIPLLEMQCTVRTACSELRVATAPSSPNHQRKAGQSSHLPADVKIIVLLHRRGINLSLVGHTKLSISSHEHVLTF